MNYAEARDLIRVGDLVAIRSNGGGLPALTRYITRSPYTHTATAIWLQDGLWLAEMGAGGNVLVPASRYSDSDFDVFCAPVGQGAIRVSILESLRGKIAYDIIDLLRVAMYNLFRFKLPLDTGGMICSAYSERIYVTAGWVPPGTLPTIPSPQDLVGVMGKPRLSVRI